MLTYISTLILVGFAAASANASLSVYDASSSAVTLNLQQFGLLRSDGSTGYNNVKITWPRVTKATSYNVLRGISESQMSVVASAPGPLADDYEIPRSKDAAWFYRVDALSRTGDVLQRGGTKRIVLSPAPDHAHVVPIHNYYNSSSFSPVVSPIKRATKSSKSFAITGDPKNGNNPMIVQRTTHDDGSTSVRTVLSSKTMCAPADGRCRTESEGFHKHPQTGETVFWAHYEGANGYGTAKVVVAWGKPDQDWTFGGAFRPTGRDSRDLSFFGDRGGEGYLVSATSMNSDTAIYRLTSDWHAVQNLAALVMKGQRREAPSILDDNGWYYLFSSGTAGWMPTAGGYISSHNISGDWTGLEDPGNAATFGAQSGGVSRYGSTALMNANRWAQNWPISQPFAIVVMPISVSAGFASYHFYKTIEQDPINNVAIGIQSGRLSSIGAKSSSSGGKDEGAANDGISNDANSYFKPDKVPFWYEVDLGRELPIEQIDLTTRLVGGSETFYSFKVSASKDGKSYKVISDQSGNKNVGFTSFTVAGRPTARFVRVNVQKITNIFNKNEADWAAGIHELSVYTQ